MVENNGNFGFPHNLSYEEGTYHRRYFYPRVVCCRRARGMMEEGPSPAQSPLASPQHRPLLAHVQGSAVVSKIARPINSCSPASSKPTADPTSPGYNPPGGLGGGTVGNARSAYSKNAPDLVSPKPGGATEVIPKCLTGKSEVILDQPLATAGFGFPYLTKFGSAKVRAGVYTNEDFASTQPDVEGHAGSYPGAGDNKEQNDYMGDAAPVEDGTLLPASPDSPTTPCGDDSNQRPVFRLSDGSDYSEDYTDMTGGTLDGDLGPTPGEITSPPVNGSDINGSSVFSDVFSDRSSDTVGTQELLDDDLPPGVTQQESSPTSAQKVGQNDGEGILDEDNGDEGINQALLSRVLKLDIDSAREETMKTLGEDGAQADVVDVLSPPLSTPEIQVDEISLQDDDLEEVGVPLEDGDDNKGGFYEDREFDFLKAQPKVKRSTSLKTYKTPPGTPKRKMVRFADALGLDLESVRHILNMEAPPKIPQSATRDLDLGDADDDHAFFKTPPTGGARYLTACFPQPGTNPSFPLMVRDRKVILESSVINDHNLSVTGTVRVANISYHKKVTVRYTTNNWLTFNDINAGYVQGSNDGPTDRFSFSISLPHYFSTGSRLQFCIQFITGGETFWDNNHGANYIVECFARSLPDSDNTWMSFL